MAPSRDSTLSQLRKGVLEYCVLAILRDEQLYSYEIVSALSRQDGLVTTEGTLYPLLGRLRREGLLSTTWRESSAGPPRRYYSLAAAGHTVLQAFIEDWEHFTASVNHVLATGASR